MRKRITAVIITAAVSVFACFCYVQVNSVRVLRVALFSGSNWGVPEEDSYVMIEQAAAWFEKTYRNVRVEYETGIPKEDYEEWIAEAVLEGETPDVIFVPSDYYAVFVENGLLENLDEYASEDSGFSSSVYYEPALDACMSGGSLYALPFESVPELMFVNQTLLKENGIPMPAQDWTWDDFLAVTEAVTRDTDGDGDPDTFGVYGYTWEQAAYSALSDFYDEDAHTADFSNQAMTEAVAFLRRLSSIQPDEVTAEMFDEGKVAFRPMNYSDYRSYMPYPYRVKKFSSFEWGCLPMPRAADGDNVSQIDTLMVAMSGLSTTKELAWEFMCYLSSDAAFQKELAMASPYVSVLKSVMQDDEVKTALEQDIPGEYSFSMDVLDAVMDKGKAIRQSAEYQQIIETADAAIQPLLTNEQDIENNLVRLSLKLNEYLRK